MMVERGDIAEEITRLAHHVEQIARAIDQKEAAGKKLDFLSQEMLREINTMGSKSRSVLTRRPVVLPMLRTSPSRSGASPCAWAIETTPGRTSTDASATP